MTAPLRGLLSLACCAVVSLSAGCDDPEPDSHGFVKIELRRSGSETENPFVGTAEVTVAMTYGGCLQEFYANNPNWRQDGADGALVFGALEEGGEGWGDRLCADRDSGQVECEVREINQNVDTINELRVRYAVEADLETRFLKFGPLPTQALAQCEGGNTPLVSIASQAVQGFDAAGNQLWVMDSFDPSSGSTNQGRPIVIRASRVDDPDADE